MALDISTAAGAMTGKRYIESLRDGREVWLDGEKIHDVSTHPAFTGMVHELARIYDLQHEATYREHMTFLSPETGNRCSLSWLLPRSAEDLRKSVTDRLVAAGLLYEGAKAFVTPRRLAYSQMPGSKSSRVP